jgi:hypothetical protein
VLYAIPVIIVLGSIVLQFVGDREGEEDRADTGPRT